MSKPEDQIYDPFTNPCKQSFFPGNKAANFLCHIQYIWNDISVLSKIRAASGEPYEKKLILKYIIIEYLSIVPYIRRFNTIIFKKELEYDLSPEQLEKLKILFSHFFDKHKVIDDELTDIRNKIGAHREETDLVHINQLWEEIKPEILLTSLSCIPPLYDFLKDLNIYTWSRKKEEGTFEFVFPITKIYTSDEEHK